LTPALTSGGAIVAAESIEADDPLAAAALRLHAELVDRAAREERQAQRFSSSHPGVPVNRVSARDGDVHDLEALRSVAAELAGG
jgi:hypothetical protein